jgi:hypothetical protein
MLGGGLGAGEECLLAFQRQQVLNAIAASLGDVENQVWVFLHGPYPAINMLAVVRQFPYLGEDGKARLGDDEGGCDFVGKLSRSGPIADR